MLEGARYWLEKITKYFTFLILFFLSSCSSVSSVVSMAANAGISSKGFSASVDDGYLKAKIIGNISTLNISNVVDVKASVSLGDVLLTGYSGDQLSRLKIVERVSKINGVKKVYNEIIINPNVSLKERAEDAIFESRLMTRLLFKSGINSNNYSLDVVSGTVYAIGLAENLDEKNNVENFLGKMEDIPKLVTIINLKNNKD